MRVLIVDDESLAVTRMKMLLQAFSEVELVGIARTADEAKSKIIKTRPDVVFLDVEIGKETGFEIIDQVASNGFRPKYIVVSAFSHYAIKAIQSKVDDYLLKPVDLASLKVALERVSGNQAILKEANNYASGTHLTNLEQTVLKGMLAGQTSKAMAAELNLSSHTIDTYRRKVLKKLGVKNTVELIIKGNHLK